MVNLNKFTREHLLNTVEVLQKFFNVPYLRPALKRSVIEIYRAFNELIKVINTDDETADYLKLKSGVSELNETAILTEIENVKCEMGYSSEDRWSADYPLRCLLVGLRDGKISYPDEGRSFLEKVIGIGKMSNHEKLAYEEKLLEPVARHLEEIVIFYNRQILAQNQ
jgi:hypothetical protein